MAAHVPCLHGGLGGANGRRAVVLTLETGKMGRRSRSNPVARRLLLPIAVWTPTLRLYRGLPLQRTRSALLLSPRRWHVAGLSPGIQSTRDQRVQSRFL